MTSQLRSLWNKPTYATTDRQLKAHANSDETHCATIDAYCRKSGRLVYEVYLPVMKLSTLRRMLGMKPNAEFVGAQPLDEKQLAQFEKLVDLRLDTLAYEYFFDSDQVGREFVSRKAAGLWRDADKSLRAALKRFHAGPKPSKEALNKTYLDLADKIRFASLASYKFIDRQTRLESPG